MCRSSWVNFWLLVLIVNSRKYSLRKTQQQKVKFDMIKYLTPPQETEQTGDTKKK